MESDFGSFYASVAPSVERLAVALTGDRHEASDLTQAVFERLLRKWPRLQVDDPLAYARAALVREVVSTRRVGFRKREVPAGEIQDTAPVPDFTGATDEADRLLAALRTSRPGSARPWCCGTSKTCRQHRRPTSWDAPRGR